MIEPGGIPQFIGDFEQLDKDVSALRSDAIGIRNGGADVHSRFQMLGAYYTAPEADDLFASTQPVMDRADTFAADLETVADALDTFSSEARPLAKRLQTLEADARKFVASVEGDDDWHYDDEKTDRNNELVDDVAVTKTAFEAAERRAATKISAIVNGPKFIEDDGSHKATKKTVMYGYDAGLLKQAKETPWGSHVSESIHAWEIHRHVKHYVWDGFIVGGGGATLEGLGHLVGIGGSAGEAWSNLGDVVAGAGQYIATPLDWVMDQTMFADKDGADVKRQKTAAREFAKAMVAWDQWEEHPVQAAGTATFNILTLGAGPLGVVAKGGKAGAASKAAGVAAKIGTYADPLSAGLTVGGKAFSKLPSVADLTARVRTGTDAAPELRRVHTDLKFDGSRVRVEDGKFIRVDAEGKPIRETAPIERSAAERTAPAEVPEPALVGAGERAPSASVHAGERLPPQASHEPPAGRGEAGSPQANGHSEVGGSAGARGNDGSSSSSSTGHAVSGGSEHGPVTRPGESGGGRDDLSSAGDDATGDGTPRPDGNTPLQPGPVKRPSFMREGPNPYRPGLTLEQIEEIQVYRANHEPGYFEKYYKGGQHLGNRRGLELTDESGFTPPQLTRLADDAPFIRSKDVPDPPKPHYLDPDYIKFGPETVKSQHRLNILDDAAGARHHAIQWDNLAKDWKEGTGKAHEENSTVESQALWGEAKGTYKESHTQMRDLAEEFGEQAARHHFIAERYKGFEEQPLLGPKNGNDQFDQVWVHKDGRVVVVEAKSSTDTELGHRDLPDNGGRVSQGSREYFLDIFRLMKKRGEVEVVAAIEKAIASEKLEYVVVHGEKNAGTYTGLQYRYFDISKGTLP
ncbi:hypothetical protein [Streptomyces sp. NPDC021622]|uniref:hypothetical protein n=1 Tax=Streptomyces sp. NPDC021622 TaxID=3155013 RepID=UPI0033CE563E